MRNAAQMPKVTLCLVTYNEESSIFPCLESIVQNEKPDYLHEIIIVDNGSTDQTIQQIENWKTSHTNISVRIYLNNTNNIGSARALAAEKAKTELLAFTDPDCLLPNLWLTNLTDEFFNHLSIDSQTAGVGGGNRLPENNRFSKAINLMLSSFFGHGNSPQTQIPKVSRRSPHLATTNVLFLRSAVLQVGNFSRRFSKVCEDVDLGIRLNDRGFHLYLLPSPVVLNNTAQSLFQWAKRMIKFSQGQRLISQVHKSNPSIAVKTSRHFLIGFCLGLILTFFYQPFWILPILYFLFVFLVSCYICINGKSPLVFRVFTSFVVTHFSYALGNFLPIGSKKTREPSPPIKPLE